MRVSENVGEQLRLLRGFQQDPVIESRVRPVPQAAVGGQRDNGGPTDSKADPIIVKTQSSRLNLGSLRRGIWIHPLPQSAVSLQRH